MTTTNAGTRTGVGACALAAFVSVVNPGTGHLAVRARVRRATIAASIVNIAATIALIVIMAPVRDKSDLTDVIANRSVFLGLGLALAAMAITRLFTAVDSAWLARPTGNARLRVAAAAAAGVLIVVGVAPLAIAADYVWKADQAVEKVFGSEDAETAFPTPLPTTTVEGTDTTGEPTTTEPFFDGEERVNILLLGGDAGPGRPGLRTDTMIVVSINAETGYTAMIAIPRNLEAMPFPEGTALAEKFPEGFNDLANAVYAYAERHPELVGDADDAGEQAIKLGISQLLGLPIHYYVLADMAGFVDIVDALGGIDIYVPKRVPTPGNPRGAKHPVPEFIKKGEQHMDGTVALAYARTREADSDYHRMDRQQCLLGAVINAATPMSLALGFTDLVAAFGDSVNTDIPRDELDDFGELLDRFSDAGGRARVHTLHLSPPLINPFNWKASEVRALVADALVEVVINEDIPLLDKNC
ncbi:MAG: LCP family protein [Ilumatobacteraceae bacterium]